MKKKMKIKTEQVEFAEMLLNVGLIKNLCVLPKQRFLKDVQNKDQANITISIASKKIFDNKPIITTCSLLDKREYIIIYIPGKDAKLRRIYRNNIQCLSSYSLMNYNFLCFSGKEVGAFREEVVRNSMEYFVEQAKMKDISNIFILDAEEAESFNYTKMVLKQIYNPSSITFCSKDETIIYSNIRKKEKHVRF